MLHHFLGRYSGVTDVKHLKAKIRPDEDARPNSPWNIAADFDVVMSFDGADVAGMLAGYEADHATGMDVAAVAAEIVAWTGGYSFLVSRVCQLLDGRGLGWDRGGVVRRRGSSSRRATPSSSLSRAGWRPIPT